VNGAALANLDNLPFDDRGNIVSVTDMSTNLHNGFTLGESPGDQRYRPHPDP
jgi:uncharacterized protein